MEADPFRVFLDMQLGLKRNAPGSDRATAHVLSLAGALSRTNRKFSQWVAGRAAMY